MQCQISHHCGEFGLIFPLKNNKCLTIYYPPCDVFALNTRKYILGCIFFVYTGAPVLWIMSVNNLPFFQQYLGKYTIYKCIIYY